MALIVETGEGVSGANSYIALADAQSFIDARGLSVTLTEGLLLSAMDPLSAVRFKGAKADKDNPLNWPRKGVVDCEGFDVAENEIPQGVIAAQIWIAYYSEQGIDASASTSTQQIKKEKVDVIEIEYFESAGTASAVSAMTMPNVKNSLQCFITASGGRINRA